VSEIENLHVLYATNSNYLTVTLASILSLIENAKILTLHFHIMIENFSDADYQKIERFFSQYPQATFHLYPIDEFNLSQYGIPFWHGTQVANSRLFFQEIMKSSLDTIDYLLYLDADTIIVGDLTSLEQYTEGIYVVRDETTNSYYNNLNHLQDYFNSGVMYIHLDTWKKMDYQTKIINFIQKNKNIPLTYPDQDILNCVLDNQTEWLPLSYNLSPFSYIFSSKKEKLFYNPNKRKITLEETIEARKDPKIIHSYGLAGIKPWMDNHINPFNDLFMQYIEQIEPNYQKEKLTLFKQLLTWRKEWFCDFLLAKTYLPDSLQEKAKEFVLYLHNH
jgi:glycosyltransferase, family 8